LENGNDITIECAVNPSFVAQCEFTVGRIGVELKGFLRISKNFKSSQLRAVQKITQGYCYNESKSIANKISSKTSKRAVQNLVELE
jgi:hypothetical protein